MSLPPGRASASHPNSHFSHSGPFERYEDDPLSSGSAGPYRPSQSGAPLLFNTHLSPAARPNSSRSRFVFAERETTGQFSDRTSPSSSAMNTPLPSRSSSPLPLMYSLSPSSVSETDSDEPGSPLLLDTYTTSYLRDVQPRWWDLRQRSRRGPRRHARWGYRSLRRVLRKIVRHPFFPKHPSTILLSLLFFTILALSITFLLIHLLDPDKEPLPWRAYCTIPQTSTLPPPLNAHPTFLNISTVASAPPMPPFPPNNFDALPPAGVFIGVFSMDSSSERRMLIRSTWATHPRSRNGAGSGDGGVGTSRTIVRFIMGQPRKAWDRRVRVEMEEFKDIIILPIPENMNSGKTHTFFTWAASMAWVPPLYFDTDIPLPNFSYSNASSPVRSLAPHDSIYARQDRAFGSSASREWVRPDFVVKVDDDSFVMLAELEARLRVALHDRMDQHRGDGPQSVVSAWPGAEPSLVRPDWATPPPSELQARTAPRALLAEDPLIYWGYLVKRRFMAGELYALSWSLVDWVSRDPVIKGLVRGAEDKQTAKWMRLHPRAAEIRWVAERCWIYDHPRSGTVYSHGFLFPSEAARAREGVRAFFDRVPEPNTYPTLSAPTLYDRDWAAPVEWARSSVSTFGTRYSLPLPNLNIPQSIEALVEGSDMSELYEGGVWSAEDAWRLREGRKTRYNGQRLGGTIVVHFVKKYMWFFETALALLEGEEETEDERRRRIREGQLLAQANLSQRVSRTRCTHRTCWP
ncbi:hypothetical protein F5148DRAFT_1190250 [Russula earlei]|uniref:Uncharacterized protein n=1 Tax=Russula earlei TaxID=71964 RepID=A0ACC0UCM8_9AGAM|nr:hypothetical protein F5148DRAFT_1190250 [Russula earlei]